MDDDQADERVLLLDIWKELRTGDLRSAIVMCMRRKSYWRAAVLQGAHLHKPAAPYFSPEGDEDDEAKGPLGDEAITLEDDWVRQGVWWAGWAGVGLGGVGWGGVGGRWGGWGGRRRPARRGVGAAPDDVGGRRHWDNAEQRGGWWHVSAVLGGFKPPPPHPHPPHATPLSTPLRATPRAQPGSTHARSWAGTRSRPRRRVLVARWAWVMTWC